MQRDYELIYIVSPTVPDDGVGGVTERVQNLIAREGGSVEEVSPWGRRRLAYRIRGYREGNYVLARLRLPPAAVKPLEAHLEISEDVLRHLVVRSGD